ncbi:MAG TPA: GGDEF domain-containing protein [Actinomycetota bacterium]|nr:GGDEF domain-containing protein [Actinomycetota bacterium]
MNSGQRITARDLLDVLAEADALEVFNQLPEAAQEDLASWIGAARDDDSHWVRIQALVAAMKSSPLNPATMDPEASIVTLPDAPKAPDMNDVRFNDLLAALRDSNLLGTSEGASQQGSARRDGDAAATLRIVFEVMTALKDSGVLDIFFHLPEDKQADFLRWIGTAADHQLRGNRTATFVAALEESPLASIFEARVLGIDRDRTAEDRDERAEAHDQASEDRDHRADARDERAEVRERASSASVDAGSAADRAGALRDRRGGASDREQAADDRAAASADRAFSAIDREESSIDGLTRAYHRESGLIELEREVARATWTQLPLIVAFIEVDKLKSTNDIDGRAAGDRRLRRAVEEIRAQLRPYDLIVRYGGNEFVCAILDVGESDASRRFDAVNIALLSKGDGSISVGLAELHPGDSVDALISRADEALLELRKPHPMPGHPAG